MNFHLIDAGWDKVIDNAIRADCSIVRVICPFIKKRTVERLLQNGKPKSLKVITRFNLDDFCNGVSDIAALDLLLKNGAQIRGVQNLHAKLYLLGSRAVVTSANLTEAGLLRNHEFGFVADDAGIVRHCQQYFDKLWNKAGKDLAGVRLADWQRMVTIHLASGARPEAGTRLGDEGTDVGISIEPVIQPSWVKNAGQAFVKFFGKSDNRAARSRSILEEVQRSGCHWACTYPEDKRPRQVQDGATMFMGRLVKEPNDILIYGRAVGVHYTEGRDDATTADIQQRPWKEQWPHYVRVHHPEFIAGTLLNGVSLISLMDALKSDASVPTQRNAAKGIGNTDPRRAYMQQPAVELSLQATAWLNDRLERAFHRHGKLAPAELEQLDWPELPSQPTQH